MAAKKTPQLKPAPGSDTPSYELEYSPLRLPDEFPIVLQGNFEQNDNPITRVHLHNCFEVGYCHEGAGIFVVEKKVLPFHAGDISVINDGEMHLARSMVGTTSRWSWIYLDPERLVGPVTEEGELLRIRPLAGPKWMNILGGNAHPEIRNLVVAIMEEISEKEKGFRSVVRGMVRGLLARFHRLPGAEGEKDSPRSLARKRDVAERIAPALEYLSDHFAETVRVEELAVLCHTSVTNLRRLFQAAVGMPPQNYLTHLRVQMGASLLSNTSRPVLDIAMSVGYPTLSSFNRHFKKYMSMTPREWRRKR